MMTVGGIRRCGVTIAALVLMSGLGAPVAWADASVDVPCETAALVKAFAATQAEGGPRVINLARGCEYRLTEPIVEWGVDDASGLPGLRGPVTVNGNNAVLRRAPEAPRFRIMRVLEKGAEVVALNDLTITGGHTRDGYVEGNKDYPAGSGAGIFNQGFLVLANTKVIGNRTGDGHQLGWSGGGHGAGIVSVAGDPQENAVSLTRGSLVRGNRTGNGGSAGPISDLPGSGGTGAGIYGHNVSIVDSEVSDNHTGRGGSAEFAGSGGDGGGIYQTWQNTLTLRNATISGNTTGDGGRTSKPATGRDGDGGEGGGIRTGDWPRKVAIADSRITGNTTGTGSGVLGADGAGAAFHNADEFVMTGTLVAGNRARSPKAEGAGLSLHPTDKAPYVIRDSVIRDNVVEGVDGVGGGIAVWLGTLNLEQVTITGNVSTAPNSGGGIHVVTRSGDLAKVNLRRGTAVRDNRPRNCNPGLVVVGCLS